MSKFHEGFTAELEKLAVSPGTKAWAVSRGITSGVAAGLMGGITLSMAQRSTPKERRRSLASGIIPASIAGAAIGMGKGMFEKGIERKMLKLITRGKVKF